MLARNVCFVMPGFMPGIHVFLVCCGKQDLDGRDTSAFTRVFDALCPAMTGRARHHERW
jgi:hypothetical protein